MVEITRRNFVEASALFGAAAAARLDAVEPTAKPFRAEDYTALRKQLRAFHPDECHERCKDSAYVVAEKAIIPSRTGGGNGRFVRGGSAVHEQQARGVRVAGAERRAP